MLSSGDISQLLVVGVPDNSDLSHLGELCPGGVVLFGRNAGKPDEMRELTRRIDEMVTRNGAPKPLISIDQEGGRVQRLTDDFTRIPPMRELAQEGANAVAAMAKRVARELCDVGIHVNFAPVCDVPLHADDTVIGHRAFGIDARVVADFAAEYVRAAQLTVMCVAKHFPGHGNVGTDSHFGLPVDSSSRCEMNAQFLPFRSCIEANVGGIMIAHISLPNVDETRSPASLSKKIVTEILRDELKFDGLVFTDDLDMKALPQNDAGAIAVRALNAGCDQLLFCHNIEKAFIAREEILRAIENRVLDMGQIEASLTRVRVAKQQRNVL